MLLHPKWIFSFDMRIVLPNHFAFPLTFSPSPIPPPDRVDMPPPHGPSHAGVSSIQPSIHVAATSAKACGRSGNAFLHPFFICTVLVLYTLLGPASSSMPGSPFSHAHTHHMSIPTHDPLRALFSSDPALQSLLGARIDPYRSLSQVLAASNIASGPCLVLPASPEASLG